MDFIVGLLSASIVIAMLYGLGILYLKLMGEWEDIKGEGIFVVCIHGILFLVLCGMIGCFIMLMGFLGKHIINLF
jgi:hypothetical protein